MIRHHSHYKTEEADHGLLLLVSPALFMKVVGTTRYHLYPRASSRENTLMVPVIYIEGDRLYAHELWPFRLQDLAPVFGDRDIEITSVCAMPYDHLQYLFRRGYTAFMAAKIKGEIK